jgi:hypothetical protein
VDDPDDKNMVRIKKAKVETWKEILKEYRVLDRFLKEKNATLKAQLENINKRKD